MLLDTGCDIYGNLAIPSMLPRLTNAQSFRLFNEVGISLACASCRCVRADGTIPANPAGPTAPAALPAYNRADWPQWIDQDGDCQDTRQEVPDRGTLIAPALDVRGCRVIAGRWCDDTPVPCSPTRTMWKSIIACRSRTRIAAGAGPGIDRASAITRTTYSIPSTSSR